MSLLSPVVPLARGLPVPTFSVNKVAGLSLSVLRPPASPVTRGIQVTPTAIVGLPRRSTAVRGLDVAISASRNSPPLRGLSLSPADFFIHSGPSHRSSCRPWIPFAVRGLPYHSSPILTLAVYNFLNNSLL